MTETGGGFAERSERGAGEKAAHEWFTEVRGRAVDGLSRLLRTARLDGGLDAHHHGPRPVDFRREASGPGAVPFHFLLAGTCTVTTASRAVELGPGDLLLLTDGEAHQATAAPALRHGCEEQPGARPELDLCCGTFRFDAAGALLFRLLPSLLHVSLVASGIAVAKILGGTTGFGSSVPVWSLCEALLATALRGHPGRRLGTPVLWRAMGDEALARVITGIVEDPAAPWTIERMAAMASMSRSTFIRRSVARTGTPVAALVTSVRMMVAIDLLTRSEHPVAHVAGRVGYGSESAFGQAFCAAVGTSPARFRKTVLV
ncbi:AraC family transcriptional regulator [Amycolatopsis carbonis]|uniref:AraC family transcriptional regulator n=1 Tax=Amycolatopsis carbonis TaxID=715471 RepID=A0A9Y2INS2_9PSEU|nr:AraC family transcriptional regulator [Amycolatopsis sp. 2-15]WIX83512.1 AraC family transcriptional regulator [Amycolatopsis sp. 2-15]